MARRGENIYKRKDGRYEGRYIKSYDMSGKAVYGYIYAKSYGEVKEKLLKCKTEKKEKTKESKMTLEEWILFWEEGQTAIKVSTLNIYKSHIKNHIIPRLGRIPLKNIKTGNLQDFINEINLSGTSARNVLSTLKVILKEAEKRGLIEECWNKINLPPKKKAFVKVLSVSEQKALEKTLYEDKDIGILICLYTGLRIGEVCALRWSDIDFENAILCVNGTQVRTKEGLDIIPPKSDASKREIPIPDFLMEKLEQIKNKGTYVLSQNQKPMDVRAYRRRFKNKIKEAHLSDIKYHSLRHTFATRALEVGMDYRTLSEILGHSSVSITLDIYAHSLKEHKINEMKKISELFTG